MLLSIIALTLLGLLLAVTFWPSNKPDMIETDRTLSVILKELDEPGLTAERYNYLHGELAYVKYIAKLTKTQATVDTGHC